MFAPLAFCCRVAPARRLTPRGKFRAVMASPQIKTMGTAPAIKDRRTITTGDHFTWLSSHARLLSSSHR
jgi:hypothetical protein